jgi:hypothetical protein
VKSTRQTKGRHDANPCYGWRRQEYSVYTRILGSTVELHATHQASGEQFICRAEDWQTVVAEMDILVARHGPGGRDPFGDLCVASARVGASLGSSLSRMLIIAAERLRHAIQEHRQHARK